MYGGLPAEDCPVMNKLLVLLFLIVATAIQCGTADATTAPGMLAVSLTLVNPCEVPSASQSDFVGAGRADAAATFQVACTNSAPPLIHVCKPRTEGADFAYFPDDLVPDSTCADDGGSAMVSAHVIFVTQDGDLQIEVRHDHAVAGDPTLRTATDHARDITISFVY
jgi:hypothetical protein